MNAQQLWYTQHYGYHGRLGSTVLRLHIIMAFQFVPLRPQGLSKVVVHGGWSHHDIAVRWGRGTISGALIFEWWFGYRGPTAGAATCSGTTATGCGAV